MAAVFTCPVCSGKLRVGGELSRGGAVRCPHCTQVLRIGGSGSQQSFPDPPLHRPLLPVPSGTNKQTWLYAIGGIAAGLVALLIMVTLLLGVGDKAAKFDALVGLAIPSAETPALQELTGDAAVGSEPATSPAKSLALDEEVVALEPEPAWVELRPPSDPALSGQPNRLSSSDVRVLFEEKATRGGPTRVVCAATPSPFVAIYEQVIDVRSGAQVGQARVPVAKNLPAALSADGRFFACADRVGGDLHSGSLKIDVVDCASGDLARSIQIPGGGRNVKWNFLAFTPDNHLFAAIERSQEGTVLFLWDAATGEVLKQWPAGKLTDAKTLSADGRFFAAQTSRHAHVQVFDVLEGKNVMALERPSVLPETTQGYYVVDHIAFSPDGTELAGVVSPKGQRRAIVVWDDRGTVIDQIPLEHTGTLAWLPDGSGWLVAIHETSAGAIGSPAVISRRLRSEAWRTLMPFGFLSPGFAGDNHLLLCGNRRSGNDVTSQVISLQWPSERIQDALGSLDAGTPALTPGQAVAVAVEVESVQFAEIAAVKRELQSAIINRLVQKGFRVAAESDVTLRVQYSEADGGTMTMHRGNANPTYVNEEAIMAEITAGGSSAVKKYEKMGLVERDEWPFVRIKVGRHKIRDAGPSESAQNTIGTLELNLVPQGMDDPVWKRSALRHSGGLREGSAFNDQTVRDDMYGNILAAINRLTIPSFVPSDPEVPVLPLLDDLSPVVAPNGDGSFVEFLY